VGRASVISYAQLRAFRPLAWLQAAAALRRLAGLVAGAGDSVAAGSRLLLNGWRGEAAGSAAARLGGLAEALGGYPAPLLAADQILAEYATKVAVAQRAVAAAVDRIGSALVRVDGDGTVRLDRSGPKPDAADVAIAAGTERRIVAALRLAEAADTEAAGRLRALLPGLAAHSPATVPDRVPPPSSPPAQVRQWWDGLTEAQRRWLLIHEPARLGALDGVPAAARDQANRVALELCLLAMIRRRAELAADPAGGPALLALDAQLRGVRALHDRLAGTGPDRAYLLGFDTGGDGRVVVSVGDPDLASHVVTYVPGVGADLAGVAQLLGNADHLAARASELAQDRPGVRAAVVLWLGYDAPDSVAAATSDSAARAAGAGLDRFQDGLRASQDGHAHFTVVGHSYGTTVAGEAARDHRLDSDELVFVGSPGVGVDRAADLGLPAGHVWSSTARWDPIMLTGVARDALGSPLHRILDPDPVDDLWFGTNPTSPRFGAHRFGGAPGDPLTAHSAYFTPGNPALDNMARIAIGDYREVR
jgi:hypothetical protein